MNSLIENILAKVLTAILSNAPLVLLIIGLFLFISGATGGWPTLAFVVNEPGWRIALAAMGFFVAATGIILFVWKEKAMPKRQPDYALKIISPRHGDPVGSEIEVSGTFKELPDKGIVKLLVKSVDRDVFWPESREVIFDEGSKSWHGKIYLGDQEGKHRTVIVATIQEAGKALFQYYEQVNKSNPRPVGIKELTPDIKVCHEVAVLRTPPSPPPDSRKFESEQ